MTEYAESPRQGGWTLRSALVRLAQPEPVRAGAVLELVRRTDRALHPHRRALDQITANVARNGVDDVEEQLSLVIRAAIELDGLADVLTRWADQRDGAPPVEAVDEIAGRVFALLAEARVPRESDRPGRGRR